MISVVMFGHALLPYVTIPRRFKDPATHVGFDAVAIFLYSFAMPVFFVTAGFTAALIYDRKGAAGLANSRFRTIFLPLLAAYLVISPLTRGAYKFAKEVSLTGSLQAGVDLIMAGDWIRWGKAYHLWFLASLLLYTALAVWLIRLLRRFMPIILERLRPAARQLFASRWRGILLALILALAFVPAYTFDAGDATTLSMQAVLFGFFVVGWLFYLHRDLLPSLRRNAWQPILAAVAVLPVAVWSSRPRLFAPEDIQLLEGLVAGLSNSLIASLMTFGLLGLFHGRFDQRPSRLGQYLSDASYWIFLIHLPILIAVAGALSVTPLPALAKYLLTVAIAVPLIFASYHLLVRSTPFGGFLKGRGKSG